MSATRVAQGDGWEGTEGGGWFSAFCAVIGHGECPQTGSEGELHAGRECSIPSQLEDLQTGNRCYLLRFNMHSFEYRKGLLHCEDRDLETLAARYGTPLFVYSASTIRDHYQRLTKALEPLDHGICYAVKACSNIAILSLLARAGSGFDIVSGGELFRVIRAGGDPSKCTFAGVCKTEDEMRLALEHGIHSFNIESEPELDRLSRVAASMGVTAPIAIRINPDVDAATHKYISTGKSENKFGVPLETSAALYKKAASLPGIEIRGVQMHIGSQILKAAPFARAIKKISPFVESLKQNYGITFLSIGGGVGIVYDPALESGKSSWWKSQERSALPFEDYAAAILPPLQKLGLRVLVEPGRVIVGNAGLLLTRVHYVKKTASKTFVIVDAGMNDLIRPALYESHHEIVPVRKRPGAKALTVDIVGPVCESGDFFAQNRPLPSLREGDLVAVLSAGAYGAAMGSNYNSRPLPAEILVSGDKDRVIRERQSLDDLIRGEQIPDTL